MHANKCMLLLISNKNDPIALSLNHVWDEYILKGQFLIHLHFWQNFVFKYLSKFS